MFALTSLSLSVVQLSRCFCLALLFQIVVLQPRWSKPHRFGLFPFRSPLLRKSLNYFLFLGVLRCFSSPGSPSASGIFNLQLKGLPHSEIFGSQCMCHSPKLIAAYHVLHRLSDPRHSPCALNYFKNLRLILMSCFINYQYVKELFNLNTTV